MKKEKQTLTIEEKKEKLKEYKRLEYLKNCEVIKKKQKEYYYKKKELLGLPSKADKHKVTILHYNENLPEEIKNKFFLSFE